MVPRETVPHENIPKDKLHPRYFFPQESEISVGLQSKSSWNSVKEKVICLFI